MLGGGGKSIKVKGIKVVQIPRIEFIKIPSKPYFMSKTEITVRQYRKWVGIMRIAMDQHIL